MPANCPALEGAEKGPVMDSNRDIVDRLLRLRGVLELLPISRSKFLEGVRGGIFPAPVRLGPACTCWRLSDIMKVVETGVA